jgi:hypothetical protein
MDALVTAFLPHTLENLTQLRIDFAHLSSIWRDSGSVVKGTISINAFVSFFQCFSSPNLAQESFQKIFRYGEPVALKTVRCFIGRICLDVSKSSFAAKWAMAPDQT